MQAYSTYVIGGLNKRREAFKAAFTGLSLHEITYWQAVLFLESALIGHSSEAPGRLPDWLRKNHPDCSLLLFPAEESQLFQSFGNKPGWLVPQQLPMQFDITNSFEKMVKNHKGLDNAARLVRKNGFCCRQSTKTTDFEQFYHDFYVPYHLQRIKSQSRLLPSEDVFTDRFPCLLYEVYHQNENIAAGLLHFKANSVYFSFLGVRNGDIRHVHNGALSALYYFILKDLQHKQYKTLEIGGSPPLLNHPLTSYKLRLGAAISNEALSNQTTALRWHVLQFSQALKSCLEDVSPLVVLSKGQPEAYAFYAQKKPDDHTLEKFRALALKAAVSLHLHQLSL